MSALVQSTTSSSTIPSQRSSHPQLQLSEVLLDADARPLIYVSNADTLVTVAHDEPASTKLTWNRRPVVQLQRWLHCHYAEYKTAILLLSMERSADELAGADYALWSWASFTTSEGHTLAGNARSLTMLPSYERELGQDQPVIPLMQGTQGSKFDGQMDVIVLPREVELVSPAWTMTSAQTHLTRALRALINPCAVHLFTMCSDGRLQAKRY